MSKLPHLDPNAWPESAVRGDDDNQHWQSVQRLYRARRREHFEGSGHPLVPDAIPTTILGFLAIVGTLLVLTFGMVLLGGAR